MTMTGLILVPEAGDPRDLLGGGPCGYQPPLVIQLGDGRWVASGSEVWVLESVSVPGSVFNEANSTRGLPLLWEDQELWMATAHLAQRLVGSDPLGRLSHDLLDHIGSTIRGIQHGWAVPSDLTEWTFADAAPISLGQVVCVDAMGRELELDEGQPT